MVPTGFHGVELADVQFGDTVLVIGIGPVGLMSVAGASLRGASRIIAVGTRPKCVEAAKKYNIPVTYTPSANAKAVAEYTVALILDAVKKITYSNNEVRNKEWNKIKKFNLEGKTLGIIGMGAIGTHIAKILCDGFGMKLIYNSRESKPNIDSKYNTNMVSLNEIFKKILLMFRLYQVHVSLLIL